MKTGAQVALAQAAALCPAALLDDWVPPTNHAALITRCPTHQLWRVIPLLSKHHPYATLTQRIH